jgi:hypothetical protein
MVQNREHSLPRVTIKSLHVNYRRLSGRVAAEILGQRCAGFSDAGMVCCSPRGCGRRPRSAKARSRGQLGSDWQSALWGLMPAPISIAI